MPEQSPVIIVDYGSGNLFSVKRACEQVGLAAQISSDRYTILRAAAVILPGVGAFGTAMENLARLNLVGVLREVAASGRPLVGVCLGMQLLMTESSEFGRHRGLGLIEGDVVPLCSYGERPGQSVKVPHVGWSRIHAVRGSDACGNSGKMPNAWHGSLLDGLTDSEFMYFVHSFYCRPANAALTLTTTHYGAVTFCSSLQQKNLFACQFHPERSARRGLQMYQNLAALLHGARRAGTATGSAGRTEQHLC